ncbi:MAG: ATP-dependent DNA helicase [Bacilli bacterium]|nr:ATP-dependent DNA helicase [Bacilli bacterium]
MNKEFKLSVHQLVDFLLRVGDIDNRVFNKATMNEGSRLHAYYQQKMGEFYISEYYLKETFVVDDFKITLDGRADGLIINKDSFVLDEIKTTVADLKEFYETQKEWHLGQAKCYALMYAHEKGYKRATVRLTYINQIDEKKMIKEFSYDVYELEEEIKKLLTDYLDFYRFIFDRTEKRNESAKDLKFPFPSFRPGQRELAKYAYGISKKGGQLFVEAPTGTGKTISTLFPFIKSFADNQNDKIFYLTAKSSGKDMAMSTIELLKKNGLTISNLLITAKEKVCYCPGKGCNPDECPFAKNYYTKLKKVIMESLHGYDKFGYQEILKIASLNGMCPFELSLDLSLFVDVIVCDYNYMFDPQVYLRRYFDDDRSKTLALVDEANNLVDRGRAMYSCSFSYESFKAAKKAVKELDHKKYKNAAKRINNMFKELKELPDGNTVIQMFAPTHLNGIEAYVLACQDINKHHHTYATNEFLDFFFEINKFNKLLELFDDSFTLYVTRDEKDVVVNLFCLDPSPHLRKTFKQIKGSIVFSATMTPTDYYVKTLGGDENTPILKLNSPFDHKNRKILVAPGASIQYKKRNETLNKVVDYIDTVISGKVGNYFVFVPSYEYLNQIREHLEKLNVNLLVQDKDMRDEDKVIFLQQFESNPTRTTVGLVIVGGSFGEGIDLVSDRLIGVIVVGVGLPQLCFERDLIKDYMNKNEQDGFDYAYVYPAINKVMQAVGRLIRTETDQGVALLIDDRYCRAPYSSIFSGDWYDYEIVMNNKELKKTIKNFWENK